MWNPHFNLQLDSGLDLQCGVKNQPCWQRKIQEGYDLFLLIFARIDLHFQRAPCSRKWNLWGEVKDEKRGQHPLEKGVYPAWPLVASCHWIPCWLAANFWKINWPLSSATPMLHNALGHILQAALTKRSSHPSHVRMQEAASLSTWGEVALRATAWHMNHSKGWAVQFCIHACKLSIVLHFLKMVRQCLNL